MNPETIRQVARITIETMSPLTIGTGRGDDLLDSLFVTDANGLPTIPGTALAGALRSALEAESGASDVQQWFGYQFKNKGEASRVLVSFGQIHDSQDRPVPFRTDEERLDDPLLASAQSVIVRQHVRITHRGVADIKGHGLFDEAVVPAGHRFTFELEVRGGPDNLLNDILSLLASDGIRLGGKTRRGYGKFNVVRAFARRFDLADREQFNLYAQLPAALDQPVPSGTLDPWTKTADHPAADAVTATLKVAPRGFWLIGGGAPVDEDGDGGKTKEPDILPYREARVIWRKEKGGERGSYTPEKPEIIVPATAVKGALRHRTTFHLNCLNGAFANDDGLAPLPGRFAVGENAGIERLFGFVAAGKDGGGGKSQAQAGRVLVDDIAFSADSIEAMSFKQMDHVSLDRFSGGPMDGMLFSEAALSSPADGDCWVIKVTVKRCQDVEHKVRHALELALRDLAEGRLQLGAGSGRGHGWMQGQLAWSDGGAWLREGA